MLLHIQISLCSNINTILFQSTTIILLLQKGLHILSHHHKQISLIQKQNHLYKYFILNSFVSCKSGTCQLTLFSYFEITIYWCTKPEAIKRRTLLLRPCQSPWNVTSSIFQKLTEHPLKGNLERDQAIHVLNYVRRCIM